MTKKKIAIVWDSILPLTFPKGDIKQIVTMALALAKIEKNEVYLIVFNKGNIELPGVKIIEVPYFYITFIRTRLLRRFFPNYFGEGGVYNANSMAKYLAKSLFPKNKFNIFHVRTRNLPIQIKKYLPDIPVVFTVIPTFLHTNLEVSRQEDQKAIDAADCLITLTDGWKKFTESEFSLYGKSICKIPVCVPSEILKLQEDKTAADENVIGYFGGLREGYGLETLIEITAELSNKIHNLKVMIAGNGKSSFKQKLFDLSKKCGVTHIVFFMGEITHKDVFHQVNKCDILVNLRYDKQKHDRDFALSIPIKCVEYAILSKPIVAIRDGGMEELLGKEYDYLIDHGDKKELIASIVKLSKDKCLAEDIGKANFSKVTSFLADNVANKLTAIYEATLRNFKI